MPTLQPRSQPSLTDTLSLQDALSRPSEVAMKWPYLWSTCPVYTVPLDTGGDMETSRDEQIAGGLFMLTLEVLRVIGAGQDPNASTEAFLKGLKLEQDLKWVKASLTGTMKTRLQVEQLSEECKSALEQHLSGDYPLGIKFVLVLEALYGERPPFH